MRFCRRKPGPLLILSLSLAQLCLCAKQAPVAAEESTPEQIPTQPEQDAMLAAMRSYAGHYISRLPNFVCVQVTQQFEAGRTPKRWHKGDTLRFKLTFLGGNEDRSLELVNDSPLAPYRRWRTPLSTEGEFGTLLGSVFGESSGTWFTWRDWETIAGRKVAVFDFEVDQAHSTMKLSLSDLARSVVPYHGSVYADPATGEIWRIGSSAFNIPKEIRTKSLSTTIQYDAVQIGGTQYLLPVKATVLLDTGSNNVRNEIGFYDYRKFETDSSVTYTSEGRVADPAKPKPPK